MGFSTFMQLIVHLFHSFDGSQRLPFLHLHETTVKDKLNGCLFHLQIFFLNTHAVHCWCTKKNNSFKYVVLY